MILMHKDTPVAEVVFENKYPVAYKEIYNEEIPIGTKTAFKPQERILLKKWYESRAIPELRKNFKIIEDKLGMDRATLFLKSSGISLTDTYWFREKEDILLWKDINFHDNDFDNVVANCLLNGAVSFSKSPDFTTDGIMEKFWYSDHGVPFLAKLNHSANKNEEALAANEIVYSKIAQSVGIETVPYIVGKCNMGQFCASPCFITNAQQDFITALQLKYQDFSRTSEALLHYFMEQLGFQQQIKEMVTLDVIMHNTDRHEKNFGIINDNGKILFAPLFDNGYCLGTGLDTESKIADGNMRLFQDTRSDILKRYMVSLEFDREYCLSIIKNIYEQFHISEQRYDRAILEFETGLNIFAKQKEHMNIYINSDSVER